MFLQFFLAAGLVTVAAWSQDARTPHWDRFRVRYLNIVDSMGNVIGKAPAKETMGAIAASMGGRGPAAGWGIGRGGGTRVESVLTADELHMIGFDVEPFEMFGAAKTVDGVPLVKIVPKSTSGR